VFTTFTTSHMGNPVCMFWNRKKAIISSGLSLQGEHILYLLFFLGRTDVQDLRTPLLRPITKKKKNKISHGCLSKRNTSALTIHSLACTPLFLNFEINKNFNIFLELPLQEEPCFGFSIFLRLTVWEKSSHACLGPYHTQVVSH
jgi:hypothetical protein